MTHRFDAALGLVEATANSTEFQEAVAALPNVASRELLEQTTNPDGTIHRITRYGLGAQLPAPVVAVLGSAATWQEIADFDPSTHTWTFLIKPSVLSGQLKCSGTYAFKATGAHTDRVVEVDLKVKVPLVGGRAEKEIKKGLVESLEAEAALLTQRLNR